MTDLDTIKAALAEGLVISARDKPGLSRLIQQYRDWLSALIAEVERLQDRCDELEVGLNGKGVCLGSDYDLKRAVEAEAALAREKERADSLERELAECREMLRLACAGHPDDHDHWTECLPCQAAFAEPLAGKEE